VVPGVTTAIAAPELAGIPVTHRGVSSGFLVIAGHAGETFDAALNTVRPNSITLVVMMGLAVRGVIAQRLQAHGWVADSRAALVCGATTKDAWTWTGRLQDVGTATPPDGVPGVLVVGEVVQIREMLAAATKSTEISHKEPEEYKVKKTHSL
jgi:uroporphyrin-III C-methyltransferase/precorrin-2 dehydrogenase/sirohydrochlorin ferrochelatase